MTCQHVFTLALCLLGGITPVCAQRQDQPLATGWKFLQQDAELTASTAAWTDVTVPHTWNALDAQRGKSGNPDLKDGYYRGACWYVRSLDIPANWEGKRVFIRFEAASIVAKTYLNGEVLGEHRGAFTAFCYELTPHLHFGARNELRVRVDNTGQPDVPPLAGDFNMDGGLYRPMHLIVTDPACISPLDFASTGVYVNTPSISDQAAEVTVRTVLSGTPADLANVRLQADVKDAGGNLVASVKQGAASPLGEGNTIDLHPTIAHPHLWNGRKDPYLYTLNVRLFRQDKQVDEITQPLGLRTFEISQEKGFLLNGQPYPIYGVNRHQDHLNKGWALLPADHDEDARLILEMGATAVRNTHYPQSQYWHDLADHNGLLMWDEVSLVNYIHDTPEFMAGARLEGAEMVHQLCNHPSIAFWGIFNELDNKDSLAQVALLNQLKTDLKTFDPARIVVAASNHENAASNQIPDALCVNAYPGWYGGQPTDMAARISHGFHEFGDRRIALSEYGAGSNPAQHVEGVPQLLKSSSGPQHPEELQTYIHAVDYAAIKDNPKLWGCFIWLMFDFPAAPRNEGSQAGLNDKGMVTQDRRVKKDAFYFYQANWSAEPMVHIAEGRSNPRHEPVTEVQVFSNCAEVDLKVNGQPLSPATGDKVNVFHWENVTLQPGENRVEATGHAGGKTVTDQCAWTLAAAPSP